MGHFKRFVSEANDLGKINVSEVIAVLSHLIMKRNLYEFDDDVDIDVQ